MREKLQLLILALLLGVNINAQNQEFTTYNEGTQYVSIVVDGQENRVWAASRFEHGASLVKLEANQDPAPTEFTTFDGISPAGNTPIASYFIRDLAIDSYGNVWVGHYGYGINNVVGGIDKINRNLADIKHYYAPYTGLQTRKVRSITVDKNDKVWAAQYHHRLIVTPPGAGDNTSTIYPGTLAFMDGNGQNFSVKGNTFRCAVQPPELPYPRNSFGEVIVPESAERNFQAISSDDSELWVSLWAYTSGPQGCGNQISHNDQILKYDLAGNFQGKITDTEMGFSSGSTITNICRNDEFGTWVTTYSTNSGFSVYKDNAWIHISSANFPNILETGTAFNANAMWKDGNGKVYMGTNNGLIVYNGIGDVDAEGSYKKYIKHNFSGTGNIIYDGTMASENIFGGYSDPNDSRINWIATDNGIMKLVATDGVELYHVNDYDCISYDNDGFYKSPGCDEEYKFLAELDNDQFVLDRRIPSMAADGSRSTVYRIHTENAQEYYNESPTKTLMVGPGPFNNITTQDYIKRYGEFKIRKLSDYSFSGTDVEIINQLEYVDFVYKHPEYIDGTDYIATKNYAEFEFKIVNENMDNIFISPIKIAVPPILLGHGVWSSISSMQPAEDYFLSHGFSERRVLKAWRTIDAKDLQKPENAFTSDSWVIPTYIKIIKKNTSENMFSVGKVNVIVHSRGGLYTRGYIEGIDPIYLYKNDVNSLITIDTPHFGSQGGNVALDRRVVVYKETLENAFVAISALTHIPVNILVEANDITVGFIASTASVPKRDNPRNGAEGKNWGARNLIVEDDNISGVVPPEDPGFISRLNSPSNLAKLNGTPIHTISAIADPCIDSPWLCLDTEVIAETSKIQAKLALIFKNMLPNALSEGLRSVTQALFNGEPNDFIVPLTSMQGGLGGTRYNTPFGLSDNLDHTGMFRAGVAKAPVVHNRILELLKSNVYDETNNGFFTQTGLVHSEITYNFLATVLDPALQRRDIPFDSKILINRDPAIFDNVVEGDVLNFNIYQEDVDRIMITYESENDSENFIYTTKLQNLVFENSFSYTIPEGYSGELKITAYGFKQGVVGYAISTVTLNVGIPNTVTLQGIHFSVEEQVILNQDNYSPTIIGEYSDGIDRGLNNTDITFTIESTSILSQIDENTVKGEMAGTTLYNAAIAGFEDTILVKVLENPSLQQTILTSFYGIPNVDNTTIAVNWETLHEYENATFVLETSYNTPDNFTEVNQQAGNGTTNTPAQFNFADTTFGANTLIYYRIKMIDTQGNITYSSTIEINLSTAGIEGNHLENTNLELYPNPTKTDKVTLQLKSNFIDKNAKLELYNIQGKRLSVQNLNLVEGVNSFNLKIRNGLVSGIYLVKVSTKGYVKTIKLIVDK